MSQAAQRTVARVWVGLFILSTAFPVIAALITETARPSWLGPLDVAVAAVTILIGFALYGWNATRVDAGALAGAYRVIGPASVILLVLVALYLLAPGSVDWVVLTIGLAWRAWLLITVLPAILVHLRPS
jgi:hypothetical protein